MLLQVEKLSKITQISGDGELPPKKPNNPHYLEGPIEEPKKVKKPKNSTKTGDNNNDPPPNPSSIKIINEDDEFRKAIFENDIKKVEKMIRNGFNINEFYKVMGPRFISGGYYITYLDTRNAISRNFERKQEKVVVYAKDPIYDDIIHWTPLHYAHFLERSDIIRLLIENGANINVYDATGRRPNQLILGTVNYRFPN